MRHVYGKSVRTAKESERSAVVRKSDLIKQNSVDLFANKTIKDAIERERDVTTLLFFILCSLNLFILLSLLSCKNMECQTDINSINKKALQLMRELLLITELFNN